MAKNIQCMRSLPAGSFLLSQEVDFASTWGGPWTQILHRLADRRSTFHFRLLQKNLGFLAETAKWQFAWPNPTYITLHLRNEWLLNFWSGFVATAWNPELAFVQWSGIKYKLGSASWIVSKLEIQIYWLVGILDTSWEKNRKKPSDVPDMKMVIKNVQRASKDLGPFQAAWNPAKIFKLNHPPTGIDAA